MNPTTDERRYLADEVEVGEFPAVADGSYVATLDGVEELDHEMYGVRWVWHWTIPNAHPDTGGDFELQVWSPPRISSSGIASEMAKALGVTVAKGAKVSLGSLRGKRAQLVVIVAETGRNKVRAALPAPSPQVATPVPTVDPEYTSWLAMRQAKADTVAAANAQEPPAPIEKPGDLAA